MKIVIGLLYLVGTQKQIFSAFFDIISGVEDVYYKILSCIYIYSYPILRWFSR